MEYEEEKNAALWLSGGRSWWNLLVAAKNLLLFLVIWMIGRFDKIWKDNSWIVGVKMLKTRYTKMFLISIRRDFLRDNAPYV